MTRERDELLELRTFIVQLGAAMNASGQPVDVVQERLGAVARAYGADTVRVSAFPTYLMVTMASGDPATLELTTPLARSRRLDQISEVDRLANQAMGGGVTPAEGLQRLEEIRDLPTRFSTPFHILGYTLQTLGICLILRPTETDVLAAALFGTLVGVLRLVGKRQPTLQVLMPVLASFVVASLSAWAVQADIAEPGLRAIVASLIVFVPGAALTNGVLELGSGEMVAGSSRLVSGIVELALLAFGILAGIQAVGLPAGDVLSDATEPLGAWAPWLGVAIFAVGVTWAQSAPPRSILGLLLVLYAAWCGQLIGNALFGGYVSALVGATVLTVTAFLVARLPAAMPPHASFLPGFWLLVPGAMGLIGLTRYAGTGGIGGSGDLVATVGSIFGVALGILVGTQLWAWAVATGRVVNELSGTVAQTRPWRAVRRRRPSERSSPGTDVPDPPPS
jgi:uncharacterized membrane protein YjjP (DUF1212 family)